MKFNCKDELVELLKKYGYNLVLLPKENITPLQLLVRKESGVWAWVRDIFATPVLEHTNAALGEIFIADSQSLPPIKKGDAANDLKGNRSSDLSVDASVDLMLNFLGLPKSAQTDTNKAALKAALSSAHKVNFSFGDKVTAHEVSLVRLDSFLKDAELQETVGNTFQEMLDNDQLYIVTSALLSNSFSMKGVDKNNASVNISLPKIKAIFDGKLNGSLDTFEESGLEYKGEKQLVFGIKAVRLICNKDDKGKNRFKIKNQEGMAVRGDEQFPIDLMKTEDNFLEL